MKTISHRGYWATQSEQNTLNAFERSFSLGLGTETDIRAYNGTLVVSHDHVNSKALLLDEFFALLHGDSKLLLALNIKEDGLQRMLLPLLAKNNIENYFLFDMSVPDAIASIRHGLRVFTRHSDVEPLPAFYAHAVGVWMDSFFDETWIKSDVIASHISAGKDVCLVSPELHGRPHLEFWGRLKLHPIYKSDRLILCTDHPEDAINFFSS